MSEWFQSYGFADVYDGLVIGAYPLDGEDVRRLATLSVRHVLNLVEDDEYTTGQRAVVVQAMDAAGIDEQRLTLVDFGRLPAEQIERAVTMVAEWLDEPGTVYVHCRAGWQRSAAVAAGAIAIREGISIDDALDQVRRRKPSADPLEHQRDDLRRWMAARSQAHAADGS
jgi:protein-tyrosine phosphatase